ncbi:hypothetical protein DL768_003122 [Monosporascus sp. mg162]|nr:hypothetical protein DL768_003122 [Monosporascus sp. mg162]
MEKQDRFQARGSSTIADYDIGCRIPSVPESVFGGYNWFLSAIRFCRVISVAYETLFSVTASMNATESQLKAVNHVRGLLESWRQSIPVDFRPREQLHKGRLTDRRTKLAAVLTQYYYYHLIIALERLTLLLDRGDEARREESKRDLMHAARTIIELIRFVDAEPYTPIL